MREHYTLQTLGLLISLVLAVSFSLVACSSPEPTPSAIPSTAPSPTPAPPVTLSQALERWDNQRVPFDIPDMPEIDVTDGNLLSYVLAGEQFKMNGDMRAAVEAFNDAITIDSEIDIPHYLLADVIYRLAFFDLVDRGLCNINLTPIEEIPEAQLHHGHLQIEIWELINPGRPAVYQELLSSRGIDELGQMRIQIYILSVIQDMLPEQAEVDIEELLQEVGGPPEVLPVPECEPDERSKPLFREAYNEILLAEQAETIETPGLMIVQKDRIADLAVRIQVFLGDEVVPISQDSPVAPEMQDLPPVLPSTLTQDPELVAIIYEIADTFDARFEGESGDLDLYGDLITMFEDMLSEDPTNLMGRLNLAYAYKSSFQYRKALDHYVVASEQAPDLADPYIGLGRIYYDLALFDMIDRGLTSTNADGLTVFHPDERTKKILRLAQETLLTSKQLTRIVQEDESGNKTYISPPGTEDQFLEMIEHHLEGN